MNRSRQRALTGLAALAVCGSGLAVGSGPALADPGGIVISELNYHAGSDQDADDWLELTNTGTEPVDMSGWSFTAGVFVTFPAGTVVAPGQRFVVAKDLATFTATNGFAPDAVYTDNLKNSTEAVTLADATGAVVDTVTYADTAPWPVSPDGTGPTLELRLLGSDNTLAENWGASTADLGTPGQVNSLDGQLPPPTIPGLTATPQRPAPNEQVAVSARLQSGSTATLTYKVLYEPDRTVEMTDTGDGVFSATIPGQAAGALVRYRVDAVSATGVAYSAPSADATTRYEGVVVANPAVTSRLPVIEWFMDDAVYADILANHRQDDYQGEAVWVLDGRVVDGVLMNVRGNSSRTANKVSWKVELPKGYMTTLGGRLPYPLDEFALQRYANNNADLAWATVRAAGARALNILPVRTQRNGSFFSLARIMETEDGEWRKDQGVEDWAIYKGDGGALQRTASVAALQQNEWLDKKTREDEDYSDVWNLSQVIDAPASASQLQWIHDNVNVPELVNYMAINAVVRHHDSGYYNWWVTRDTEGTGRWELWHWDLDLTFSTAASDGKGEFLTPDTGNRLVRAMLGYPEIRQMYFRRLRTLADQFLPAGRFEAQWDAITADTGPEWSLDYAKWGGYGTPTSGRASFLKALADRRTTIANNTGAGRSVPTSQSPTAGVVISELQYQPSGGGGEFVELANPSTTAVDISGWTFEGVGLTVQPGTVVPAGGQVVFVSDDNAFRARFGNGSRFVGGEFTGDLDDAGETVAIRQGDRVVDSVTYGSSAPWPAAAAGTGPSLELTSLTADNALPASWAATSATGGTPGRVNTGGTVTPTTEVVLPRGSTWRYNDTRVNLGTGWRAAAYNDTAWAQGRGQLGFGDGDETTLLNRGPSTSRLVTAYFRTTFQVGSRTGLTRATVDLLRDDGAVVYVNGTQVARSNMPTGTVAYGTFASTDVTGTNESRLYGYQIPLTLLRDGTNTIAVEVHQRTRTSDDLSFDAQVTLTR